jgi:hypothetical protein
VWRKLNFVGWTWVTCGYNGATCITVAMRGTEPPFWFIQSVLKLETKPITHTFPQGPTFGLIFKGSLKNHLFDVIDQRLTRFSIFVRYWKNSGSMKMAVFWVVAPCRLVYVHWRFGDLYYLHRQGETFLTSHEICRSFWKRMFVTVVTRAILMLTCLSLSVISSLFT